MFAIGDKVLINTHNLNLKSSNKFKDQHIRLFVVLYKKGKVAYRLDLSSCTALCNVHSVFHISLLWHWCSIRLHHTAPPMDVDDEVEYEDHCIKAYRMQPDEL